MTLDRSVQVIISILQWEGRYQTAGGWGINKRWNSGVSRCILSESLARKENEVARGIVFVWTLFWAWLFAEGKHTHIGWSYKKYDK